MIKKLSHFVLHCLAFSSLAAINDLDSIVNHALDTFNIPGVAIGVVVDGEIVLSKGYGYRNLDKQLPVTENTLFAIGSCSKAFTAFILGQLVDEGKISWDDPVNTHIPEFRLMDPYATEHVTIRDLLAHRSGLAGHDLLWCHPDFTRADVIPSLQHLEPACTLREKFNYNNLMYIVAGIIIEKVTGQTWEEALSSRILAPLSMVKSNASIQEMQNDENYSSPYSENASIPFRNLTCTAPSGAINSNVSDMVNWIQLQLSNGTFQDKRLISKETLEEMHTIQMAITSPHDEEVYGFGYGLGWCVGIFRGNYYLNHAGGVDGFISQVSLLPQQKMGVVVLTNSSSDGAYVVSSITNTIIDQLLEKTNVDWVEKSKAIRAIKKEPPPVENSNTTPSHQLEEYVGHYEHPAYGILQVKLEDNHLLAVYGDLTFPFSHKCDDLFNGKADPIVFGNNTILSFSFSNDLSEVAIPFDTSVKPIVFKKK